MHELGVLYQAMRTIERIAAEQNIQKIRYVTLEVGKESTYVPMYLKKLFPIAAERFPVAKGSELRLQMVSGRSLLIKEIGY